MSGSNCNVTEHECDSRNQCIPKSFHCDGETDCQDQSDEIGCRKPTVTEPPVRTKNVNCGDTFVLTCRVIGKPVPTVIWRLNWGHVSDKCTMTRWDLVIFLTFWDKRKYQKSWNLPQHSKITHFPNIPRDFFLWTYLPDTPNELIFPTLPMNLFTRHAQWTYFPDTPNELILPTLPMNLFSRHSQWTYFPNTANFD